jgi:hypothetical protein
MISFSIFYLEVLFLMLLRETVEYALRSDCKLVLDADDNLLELSLSSVLERWERFRVSDSAIFCLCTRANSSYLSDFGELILAIKIIKTEI